MIKKIKNWDKLNNNYFGFDATMYEIQTGKVDESIYENRYCFEVFNLSHCELMGSLIIGNQNNHTNYIITLNATNSPNFIIQYKIEEDTISNFDLFKETLKDICLKMLNHIKETKQWKIKNGYTI